MPTYYNINSPELYPSKKAGHEGEMVVSHHHDSSIPYSHFGNSPSDRKRLQETTDHQITLVKGCMTFFKTYTEDKSVPVEKRAAASAALREDEERLKELQRHRPACALL